MLAAPPGTFGGEQVRVHEVVEVPGRKKTRASKLVDGATQNAFDGVAGLGRLSGHQRCGERNHRED